jgi:hypothetical protein
MRGKIHIFGYAELSRAGVVTTARVFRFFRLSKKHTGYCFRQRNARSIRDVVTTARHARVLSVSDNSAKIRQKRVFFA